MYICKKLLSNRRRIKRKTAKRRSWTSHLASLFIQLDKPDARHQSIMVVSFKEKAVYISSCKIAMQCFSLQTLPVGSSDDIIVSVIKGLWISICPSLLTCSCLLDEVALVRSPQNSYICNLQQSQWAVIAAWVSRSTCLSTIACTPATTTTCWLWDTKQAPPTSRPMTPVIIVGRLSQTRSHEFPNALAVRTTGFTLQSKVTSDWRFA